MGADIYLESVYEANSSIYEPKFLDAVKRRNSCTDEEQKKVIQKEVEKYYDLSYSKGYFRDSYNATSLFSILELSWWALKYDNGYLSIPNAKILLDTIQKKKIPSAAQIKTHLEGHGACLDDKENSPEAWRKMFVGKKRDIVKLLKASIKKNEPLACSV